MLMNNMQLNSGVYEVDLMYYRRPLLFMDVGVALPRCTQGMVFH